MNEIYSEDDLRYAIDGYVERLKAIERPKALLKRDEDKIYNTARKMGLNTQVIKLIVKIAMIDDKTEDHKTVLKSLYRQAMGIE